MFEISTPHRDLPALSERIGDAVIVTGFAESGVSGFGMFTCRLDVVDAFRDDGPAFMHLAAQRLRQLVCSVESLADPSPRFHEATAKPEKEGQTPEQSCRDFGRVVERKVHRCTNVPVLLSDLPSPALLIGPMAEMRIRALHE
jgi:hypothetical protein